MRAASTAGHPGEEAGDVMAKEFWLTAPDELGGGDFPVSTETERARCKAVGYVDVKKKDAKPGPAEQPAQRSGGPTQGLEKP